MNKSSGSGNGHKMLAAGAAVVAGEIILSHFGGPGVIVGLFAGPAAWVSIENYEEVSGKSLALPVRAPRAKKDVANKASLPSLSLGRRLVTGKSYREAQAAASAPGDLETAEDETVVIDEPEADSAFVASDQAQANEPGVPRITLEQMIAHTKRNSYEVYIGRSLTQPRNPAVKIDFFKRHLKLIGASQHGKSSAAAALLEAILRTHDPRHVQVALLDLENKTSRLFAEAPHVLKLRIDNEVVRFHARSYEEVLTHLEYLVSLVDYRYNKLSDEELEKQPLLIVYLEEFLDLKDYFKARTPRAPAGPERDQAKRDYTRLVYCIKRIASRGLKVLVQLLMCAQVNYRDEDLQEALMNVRSGLSFCVAPSAAAAAGFYQNALLQRNAREDKVGQAVAEMPECKDLILAPEYDLATRLRQLPATTPRDQVEREPLAFPGSRPAAQQEQEEEAEAIEVAAAAATGTDDPVAARLGIALEDAYRVWQSLERQGVRELERVLNIPYNRARNLVIEMQRAGLIGRVID